MEVLRGFAGVGRARVGSFSLLDPGFRLDMRSIKFDRCLLMFAVVCLSLADDLLEFDGLLCLLDMLKDQVALDGVPLQIPNGSRSRSDDSHRRFR